MPELVEKALVAKRESKHIEFKHGFDPTSTGEWCEVIKDVVAIANSGGGIVVFGLDSAGAPTGAPVEPIGRMDPADITNKISKYTGPVDLQVELCDLEKQGHPLEAFLIAPALVPVVFQKPGTYDIGSGKQRTAFGVGTVYFRHGAKSEPGTTDDVRSAIERQLESIRRSWLKDVRRVVQASPGTQFVAVPHARRFGGSSLAEAKVRVVNDPSAIPVVLTRDPGKSIGSFIHEEVSDAIFDEINNVIDANRVLASGQSHFLLGQPVYFRVYAERHHVSQSDDDLLLLLRSAVCDFYCPALFWTLMLSGDKTAGVFAELYLRPKSPQIHFLLRTAPLLGSEFCKWLYGKRHRKWQHYSQPPSFYFTFEEMVSNLKGADPRLVAARISVKDRIEIPGVAAANVRELLANPQQASSLLSAACMRVFGGGTSLRATARVLDFLAYGVDVSARATDMAQAIVKAIGDQEAGDLVEAAKAE
jgi:hypothetical protein